jgi:hypothetical protein
MLFQRMSDEAIEKQIQKLKKEDATTHVPLKPDISFEDFEKMDLRVVKVLQQNEWKAQKNS